MKKEISSRLEKWDILKFILIFLVVLGHIADFSTRSNEYMRTLYLAIYTFHMPLFIFVSGLFAKKTVNEKRKDKIFGYLVMYFVLKFINFLYFWISAGKTSFSVFTETGLPWFMLALFAHSLITIAVKDFSPKYVMVFGVLVACLAGYDKNINSFLALSRIIVFFPFYYAGYLFDTKKIETHCRKALPKILSVIIITAFVLTAVFFGERYYWLRPLVTGANPFASLNTCEEYGFLIRLGYYAVAAALCYAVIVLTPSKTPLGIAAKIGRRTLPVYAFHYIILYILYYNIGIQPMLEKLSPVHWEWFSLPLALAVTLFSANGLFNKIINLAANVPAKHN
ncbi:MAG: acyltransferase family protein [Clostridia bacterium]|nr:acyltransferase family protein [Clostridia bacterium]